MKNLGTQFNRVVQQKLKWIRQRYSIGKLGAVLLGIPAACLSLVLLGVSDVRQQERQIERNIQLIEKRMRTSELILRYMVDQETGVRGYLLTRDEQFLQPYHTAKQALPNSLAELKQQAPDQSEILQKLDQQIQQRFQDSEKLLQFAQATDRPSDTSRFDRPNNSLAVAESAQLLQLLRQARQSTDAIRQTIEDLKQQQYTLMSHKQSQLYNRKQFVDQVQLLGALLSVLSYIGVVFLFQLLDRGMVQRDKEIQQTQETIQTLTNHLVDGVMMLDRRGRIESLNPAAERILGQSSQALTGRLLLKVLFPAGLGTPSDNNMSDTAMPEPISHSDAAAWVQARAETGIVEQLQAPQADGSMVPIELSISRSTSTFPKLLVLIRDVSERMQLTNALSDKVIELGELNRQLFIANATLQRKNQSLETFVKAAAHDLKTPIRGIASLAQWLETDLGESLTLENQTSLHLLNQRVLRMQAIANGLLSYANIDEWVKRHASVNSRILIQEVCQQIGLPTAFSVQIQGEMPTLRTPYLALKLVFEQLIRNAIEHHDQGRGVIEIIAMPREHCTEFIVRDDGPGIAPAYRDLVLHMFQVLDHNPDNADNIGVGLALVHKTIQLVGGTLDLTSATKSTTGRDRGLEVHFTWPLLKID